MDENKIKEYLKRIEDHKKDTNEIKSFVGKSGVLNGVEYYIEIERKYHYKNKVLGISNT